MDDIIYFFYEHGLKFVIALIVLKSLLIFYYKGLDLAYLFENFLVIYSDHGLEPNPRRKKFRLLHNFLTIVFYILALAWLAITFVVKSLN